MPCLAFPPSESFFIISTDSPLFPCVALGRTYIAPFILRGRGGGGWGPNVAAERGLGAFAPRPVITLGGPGRSEYDGIARQMCHSYAGGTYNKSKPGKGRQCGLSGTQGVMRARLTGTP